MHNLRKFLPSANALFVFEAAARRSSFTAAASELNVSQPAVSKTIRQLEEASGLTLFRRSPLALTAEGERLFAQVRAALDGVHDAIATLRAGEGEEVRASFSTAFVAQWLLPRLPGFKAEWPGIRLRIEESTQDAFDLVRAGVDLSMRLGDGDWHDVTATRFVEEEVLAVCSPGYLSEHGRPGGPGDLLHHRLLHSEEPHRKRMGWSAWLEAQGVRGRVPRDLVFTDNLATTRAAVLGQGIAIGWLHLVADDLAAGRLVEPLALRVRTGKALWLVMPAGRAPGRGVMIFRDWLLDEVAR